MIWLSFFLKQVVIVSPTRELTLQIFTEARKFAFASSLKICVAYGGTAVRHQGDNIAVSFFNIDLIQTTIVVINDH